MFLTWLLCHHDGREFRLLHDRDPGAEVAVELNGQRTANLSVPSNQVESLRGGALIHPGRARLKVFAHPAGSDPSKALIFNGLITAPRSFADRVEITAVDQSIRLLNGSPAPLKDPGVGSIRTIDQEASLGLWKIIKHTNDRVAELQADEWPNAPGVGIKKGDLAATGITRELVLPDGESTWDLIQAEVARNRSPDFELEPLDTEGERDDGEGAGEIHAKFNTYYPKQGSDLTDSVILEDGLNAKIVHEPSVVEPGLCNRYVCVGRSSGTGAIAPVVVAENRASIETFGVWQKIEAAVGVTDTAQLRRRAEAYVAAHSRHANFFDVNPAAEVDGQAVGWAIDSLGQLLVDPADTFQIPPVFLPGNVGDYWIGDEVTIRSKRFRFRVDKGQKGPQTDWLGRITKASFRELDAGANVGVTLTASVEEDAAAVISYESEIFTGT